MIVFHLQGGGGYLGTDRAATSPTAGDGTASTGLGVKVGTRGECEGEPDDE
jgi:hypothetical protein